LSRGFSRILKRQHVFINNAQSGENIDIETIENWHESFIEHLASVLKPRVYVELGLYRCELFNRVIPYAQRLIGVDVAAEAGKWMAKSDKVKFVNSSTDEYAATLQAHPMSIDMLFIDADHSKEAVLRDFWNFFPFVSRHELIILHDTFPKNIDYTQPGFCADAYKAIEELSKYTDKFEMMTIPVHPGLTLCRKRITQLSWLESND
jgi:predicted O-methyltransferase YrrM